MTGMAAKRLIGAIGALAAAASLGACGFKPIYATTDEGGRALVHSVAVAQVNGPETVEPLLASALASRMKLQEGEDPRYELYVAASESAQRLAVQIDASVTRYNYRLNARYSLLDLETGDRINGRALAVTSFNIVDSQYSTLFAESNAQEKASRQLAAAIERDILTRFASEATDLEAQDDNAEDFLREPERDFLPEIRREFEARD